MPDEPTEPATIPRHVTVIRTLLGVLILGIVLSLVPYFFF